MSLHNNLHNSLKHNFSRVFKKLARFDVSRVYYRAGQYKLAFERYLSRAIWVVSCVYSRTESFKLSSRELSTIGNRERLMLLCS